MVSLRWRLFELVMQNVSYNMLCKTSITNQNPNMNQHSTSTKEQEFEWYIKKIIEQYAKNRNILIQRLHDNDTIIEIVARTYDLDMEEIVFLQEHAYTESKKVSENVKRVVKETLDGFCVNVLYQKIREENKLYLSAVNPNSDNSAKKNIYWTPLYFKYNGFKASINDFTNMGYNVSTTKKSGIGFINMIHIHTFSH